jgi:hypothetical protein
MLWPCRAAWRMLGVNVNTPVCIACGAAAPPPLRPPLPSPLLAPPPSPPPPAPRAPPHQAATECYNPVKDTWTRKADMLQPRGDFAAEALPGVLRLPAVPPPAVGRGADRGSPVLCTCQLSLSCQLSPLLPCPALWPGTLVWMLGVTCWDPWTPAGGRVMVMGGETNTTEKSNENALRSAEVRATGGGAGGQKGPASQLINRTPGRCLPHAPPCPVPAGVHRL